jgi:hypothetical protein
VSYKHRQNVYIDLVGRLLPGSMYGCLTVPHPQWWASLRGALTALQISGIFWV